ncbi:MAG: TylF/MycF/NovP-related O-methyltransferase [Candidatus Omnitrophota bacterium]
MKRFLKRFRWFNELNHLRHQAILKGRINKFVIDPYVANDVQKKLSLDVKTLRLVDLPAEHSFNSSMIHTNCPRNQEYWQYLLRGYDGEAFMKEAIQKVRAFTMCTYDALLNICAVVRYLEEGNIKGAFVETGVCSGGSTAVMALASLKWGKGNRHFHLFDSFEGIPNPQLEKDYCDWMAKDWAIPAEQCDGKLVSSGALIASQADAEKVLFDIAKYPKDLATFHVGWFQNTVPVAAKTMGPIALLRLDGDLYESTLVCLRNLYPLVNKGGFIIIDDWSLKGCRTACEEFFKEIGIRPFIHYADFTVRYFVKD